MMRWVLARTARVCMLMGGVRRLFEAVVWTLWHWFECPLCRWNWLALWHDLQLEELRYVMRVISGGRRSP